MDLTTTDKKDITADVHSFIQRRMRNISDSLRMSALENFRQLGLPVKHEEYKYTPITRELEKNFSFGGVVTEPVLKHAAEFLIPDLDANIIVFFNSSFSAEHSVINSTTS